APARGETRWLGGADDRSRFPPAFRRPRSDHWYAGLRPASRREPGARDMPDTLFTHAHLVLDGSADRQTSFHVLVKGNTIDSVSARPIDRGDAAVIDVAGRTLMPGLIDAHAHITGLSLSPRNIAYPA